MCVVCACMCGYVDVFRLIRRCWASWSITLFLIPFGQGPLVEPDPRLVDSMSQKSVSTPHCAKHEDTQLFIQMLWWGLSSHVCRASLQLLRGFCSLLVCLLFVLFYEVEFYQAAQVGLKLTGQMKTMLSLQTHRTLPASASREFKYQLWVTILILYFSLMVHSSYAPS